MMDLATVPINRIQPSFPFFAGTNTVFEAVPRQRYDEGRPELSEKVSSVEVYTGVLPTKSLILGRLYALRFEDAEDNYGRLRPTRKALSTALGLIERTESTYGTLPAGSISTDSEGGIRITWLYAQHQVQVICPTDSSDAHLYFEHGDEYDMEHELTSAVLVKHLRSAGLV